MKWTLTLSFSLFLLFSILTFFFVQFYLSVPNKLFRIVLFTFFIIICIVLYILVVFVLKTIIKCWYLYIFFVNFILLFIYFIVLHFLFSVSVICAWFNQKLRATERIKFPLIYFHFLSIFIYSKVLFFRGKLHLWYSKFCV